MASAPDQVNLTAASAVVVWTGADGQAYHLQGNERDQLTFDVQFAAASKTAFFKLRVLVKLKDLPAERTPLFLYIHPDRVTSLAYDGPDRTPDDVRQKLGPGDIICLRFGLSKPADMIVPRASSLTPRKQKGHGDKLDALRLLAHETQMSVYLAQNESLSEALLLSLSAAIAEGGLQAPDRLTDLPGLYSGMGGEVFRLEDVRPPPPTTAPPSYEEVGASPPPAPSKEGKMMAASPVYRCCCTADIGSQTLGAAHSCSSRKRRRGSSLDTTGDGSCMGTHNIEATCRKMMQDMMSQFRQEERAFLRSELQQIKTEMTEYVDKRLDGFARDLDGLNSDVYRKEDVDEQIEAVREYNEDRIDVKVEDRVDYVKLELEEYVEGQIAGAEDRVMGRLRRASLSLDIQDD